MLSDRHTDPILVVDDDDDLREGLVDILEREGFEVAEASDGAAALALLRRGLRPKFILLDLMMPVMDGESFCKAWQADASISSIPVIILSAEPAIATKAEDCRATAFIPKPFEREKLFQTIEQVVPRR
jgi:CheY-like chemotaxis protein